MVASSALRYECVSLPPAHLRVMKTCGSFLILFLGLLCRTLFISGRTVKDTVEEWNLYRNNCLLQMSTDPTPTGVFCGRMFDMYACWPDGKANSTVKVPCPWYLPWYHQVHDGFVMRDCDVDGHWATNDTSRAWRDHSQCDSKQDPQEEQITILAYFQAMYTVGYSISLASLSLALVILLLFRKLRCTRNYIHSNLFASFILRAVSILTRDALLNRNVQKFTNNRDVLDVLSDHAESGCRAAQVLMQYFVAANHYWLLVEGLYLHNLLVMMVFSGNTHYCGYVLIGWGTPVLFVIPWVVVRHLYENTRCWEVNENMAHWWIIRGPILMAILVNFFIFIHLIRILVSKLKANQMRYTDYKFRLAKSTLTLIPLLGIHEVIFAVLTEEHTEGVLRSVYLFFELFLNSFQGALVAILYCFVNKEVQAEIKKKWQIWKVGMTLFDYLRNSGSNTPQTGAGQVHLFQSVQQSAQIQPNQCPDESRQHNPPDSTCHTALTHQQGPSRLHKDDPHAHRQEKAPLTNAGKGEDEEQYSESCC